MGVIKSAPTRANPWLAVGDEAIQMSMDERITFGQRLMPRPKNPNPINISDITKGEPSPRDSRAKQDYP